jgi:anti-sigma regulatory factor (Ser/Thr protein kinase)
VRTILREWEVADEVRDDTEMVISELFTNAVRHTASELISCELRLADGRVHIEVTDEGNGPTEPQQRAALCDEEGGRGLLLVGLLSLAWGVRPRGIGRGRTVWAELAL